MATSNNIWQGPALDALYKISLEDKAIQDASGNLYSWDALDKIIYQAQSDAFGEGWTSYGREDSRLPQGMSVRTAIALGYGPFSGHNVSTIPVIRTEGDDNRNLPSGENGVAIHNSQWLKPKTVVPKTTSKAISNSQISPKKYRSKSTSKKSSKGVARKYTPAPKVTKQSNAFSTPGSTSKPKYKSLINSSKSLTRKQGNLLRRYLGRDE